MNNLFNQPQDTSTQVVEDVTEPKVTKDLMIINDNQIVITQDAKISFKDYDIIEKSIDESLLIFNDPNFKVTADNVSKTKETIAKWRKGVKKYNEIRITLKKKVLEPYTNIEKQCKTLDAKIVGGLSIPINALKDYDQELMNIKKLAIEKFYNKCLKEYPKINFISLDLISDAKWYNVGTTLKKINEEIKNVFDNLTDGLVAIDLEGDNGARVKRIWSSNGYNFIEAKKESIIELNQERIEQEKIDANLAKEGLVVPKIKETLERFEQAMEINDSMEKIEPIEEPLTDGSQKEGFAVFGVRGGVDDLIKLGKIIDSMQIDKTLIKSISDYNKFKEEL